MTETLRIFIGYDSKEPVAFHVLAHSILTRATRPVSIIPLRQDTLRLSGIYTRDRGPTESTEFSLTRFLVPYLSRFQGHSVFMDSDMLCRVDLTQLWAEIDRHMGTHLTAESKGVLVCQHDYTPQQGTKFLGNVQTIYPRKNWSSFMVFDNWVCRHLTPEYVNGASGLELHRFQWLKEQLIGSLPLEWNWLVGEYPENPRAKVLHWTMGGPWYSEYADAAHASEWRHERRAMLGLEITEIIGAAA